MHLLNVKTLKLEQKNANIPPYAILSHQWSTNAEDEVNFDSLETAVTQIRKHIHRGSTEGQVNGVAKIAGCCLTAADDPFNLSHIWVDTCCIDKKSSTELSEAINSMYNYYHESKICFAYLADVTATSDESAFHDQVRGSRWFTRGWTLQELLAPDKIIFFNRDWVRIGDKHTLKTDIRAATMIAAEHLDNFHSASVATKLSWASKRQTTRIEDRAYSLLGIFGVSMYLQYGEREKAFRRFQVILIETIGDESIFAWTSPQENSGILALEPDFFQYSADIISDHKNNEPRKAPRVVQNTLEFHVPKSMFLQDSSLFFALHKKLSKELGVTMNCWRRTASGMRAIKIVFKKINGNWRRVNCGEFDLVRHVPSNSYLGQDKTVPYSLTL
ncbi:MAG: hypothetical protein L6R41_005617 [Letrouitia leprolyta]|nr:MAG: hypothetical protein L6R41_005617 [Letrouitia leprolyta]